MTSVGIRGVGAEDLAAQLDRDDERPLPGGARQRLGRADEGARAARAAEPEERPAARVPPQPEARGEERVDARRREAGRRHEEEVVDRRPERPPPSSRQRRAAVSASAVPTST